MKDILHKIDEDLIDVSRGMDFFSLITPVNKSEEKDIFFKNHAEKKRYNPYFEYRESDLAETISRLDNMLPELNRDDRLHNIFIKKIQFLKKQVKLIESGDDIFPDISRELYGGPLRPDTGAARAIMEKLRAVEYRFPEETVTPAEMRVTIKKCLDKKGIDWTVALSDRIVPKVSVSGKDRTIYINSRLKYTEGEVIRLMTHEVEIHAVRGANGEEQPFLIFRDGLAGYSETEEGLAVMGEEAAGCLDIDTRQMWLYAARCVAVDIASRGDFYDVFAAMKRYFPDDLSYRLAERVKRGLRDTSSKGAFTKELHYISGLRKIRNFIANEGNLSNLFVGKIGLDDIADIEILLKEGVLKPPGYLPVFIDKLKS